VSQCRTFAAIILCVASQRMFIVVRVYFVMTQPGDFWTHPRIVSNEKLIANDNFSGFWKEALTMCFKVLLQETGGGSEEICERPESG
jgi:hypothetical protein